LDGQKNWSRYEVVAQDRDSVVVRVFTRRSGANKELLEEVFCAENLLQIRFDTDGEHYSIFTQYGLIEWFKRVA
jgi:hypothetical protein